jgi:hypothetical protein
MKKGDVFGVTVCVLIVMLAGVGMYQVFSGGPLSFGFTWAWPTLLMFITLAVMLMIFLDQSGFYIPIKKRNTYRAAKMEVQWDEWRIARLESRKQQEAIEVGNVKGEVKLKFNMKQED